MSQRIIVGVAPVGGWGKGDGNPLGAERIAAEVVECAAAGAALVHLHARDGEGNLTEDQSELLRTTQLIREQSDILIEASTGGLSNMTAQERALPVKCPQASIASLNMGSLNFHDEVYCNSVPDIKLWLDLMRQAGVKPGLEIFDTGNVTLANHLIEEGLIESPYNFNFVFNYKWGMEFSGSLLEVLKDKLPQPSIWGAVFGKNRDFSHHLHAAQQGAAMVRVGFEDSNICNDRPAASNRELVETIRAELEGQGFEIAGTADAGEILSVS
jgi:3-keto-5-aminohexanoate cleavage enzyme